MKIVLFLVSLTALCCGSLFSRDKDHEIVVRPNIDVRFESEISEIASGYEKAFERLPAGPRYVLIQSGDKETYLEGSIRSIQALGGVLLITSERGPSYVISARKVINISNKKPPKQ